VIGESISEKSKLKLVFVIEGVAITENSGAFEPSLPFTVVDGSTIQKRRTTGWGVRSVHLLSACYSPTLVLPLN